MLPVEFHADAYLSLHCIRQIRVILEEASQHDSTCNESSVSIEATLAREAQNQIRSPLVETFCSASRPVISGDVSTATRSRALFPVEGFCLREKQHPSQGFASKTSSRFSPLSRESAGRKVEHCKRVILYRMRQRRPPGYRQSVILTISIWHQTVILPSL